MQSAEHGSTAVKRLQYITAHSVELGRLLWQNLAECSVVKRAERRGCPTLVKRLYYKIAQPAECGRVL